MQPTKAHQIDSDGPSDLIEQMDKLLPGFRHFNLRRPQEERAKKSSSSNINELHSCRDGAFQP